MSKRPGPELLDAWKHYIRALCRQLTSQEIAELKHDLLDRARDVAEAAGGILGVGNKVSANERAALRDLEQALPKTRSAKIMRRVLRAKEWGEPIGDTSTLEDEG